eukprot:gene10311-2455_t
MPVTNVPEKNIVHQADLLHLPNDNGFRFALVVVDLATGMIEAKPLKSKDANTFKDQLNSLYSRHPKLKLPIMLQVDSGGEFSKLNRLKIPYVRYGKPEGTKAYVALEHPVDVHVRDKKGKVEWVAYTPERLLKSNYRPVFDITKLDPPKSTHFRVAEIMETRGN